MISYTHLCIKYPNNYKNTLDDALISRLLKTLLINI